MLPFPWIPGDLEETHPMCAGRAKPVSHSWRSPRLPVRWSWGGAGKREGEGQGKARRRPLSTSNPRGWFPQTRREIWLCYFSLEVNQWNSDVYLTSFPPSSSTKSLDVIQKPSGYFFPSHWFLPTWSWLSQFSLSIWEEPYPSWISACRQQNPALCPLWIYSSSPGRGADSKVVMGHGDVPKSN